MRVLGISGSLRANSSNAAALAAAAMLAPAPMVIDRYDGLEALPPFNPDRDGERAPRAVVALRRMVGDADAVLISSPEYAHGVPGSLKNLLDWLVPSGELSGKRVALINTSPRAHHAQEQLVEILSTMDAALVEPGCVTLPLLGRAANAAAIVADEAIAASLRGALAVICAVEGR